MTDELNVEFEINTNFDAPGFMEELDQQLHIAMQLAVDLIAADAKDIAPKRSSKLAGSIQALPPEGRFSDDNLTGTVSAGAEYAAFVEFGTGIAGPKGVPYVGRSTLWGTYPKGVRYLHPGMEPRPYLRPALEQNRADIDQLFSDAVDFAFLQALEKHGTD